MGVVVHLPQRPHFDAGGVHRDHEHREPFVLGLCGVCTGQADAPFGPHRPAGPRLLSTQTPHVAVPLGAERHIREVRARFWLGEHLAPDLGAGSNRTQPAVLLLGGSVCQQSRTDHAQPDGERVQVGHHVLAQHRADEGILGGRRVPAAMVSRPGRHVPAAFDGRRQIRPTIVEVVAARSHRRQPGLFGASLKQSVEHCADVVGGERGCVRRGIGHQLRVRSGTSGRPGISCG